MYVWSKTVKHYQLGCFWAYLQCKIYTCKQHLHTSDLFCWSHWKVSHWNAYKFWVSAALIEEIPYYICPYLNIDLSGHFFFCFDTLSSPSRLPSDSLAPGPLLQLEVHNRWQVAGQVKLFDAFNFKNILMSLIPIMVWYNGFWIIMCLVSLFLTVCCIFLTLKCPSRLP